MKWIINKYYRNIAPDLVKKIYNFDISRYLGPL